MAEANSVRNRAEAILQEGLDHYALGQIDDAVRCWRAAQALDPGDRRAAEYLEAAGQGGGKSVPGPEAAPRRRTADQLANLVDAVPAQVGPPAAGVDRSLFRRQLAERRYEDALALLYRWRESKPEDDEIARGIRLLEERLILDYAQTLGGDGCVLAPAVPPGDSRLASLDRRTRELLSLADGVAPVAQLVGRSGLGRFDAYRLLAELRQNGLLRAPAAAPAEREVAPAAGSADAWDELFHRATIAYLRCDYGEAKRDFEACLRLRPEDRRVQQNLRKLADREKRR